MSDIGPSWSSCSVFTFHVLTDIQICDRVSALNILSLNSCGLNDAFFTSLLKSCEGKLLSLVEVDIASNENLSVACIRDLVKMTSSEYRSTLYRTIQLSTTLRKKPLKTLWEKEKMLVRDRNHNISNICYLQML